MNNSKGSIILKVLSSSAEESKSASLEKRRESAFFKNIRAREKASSGKPRSADEAEPSIIV